MQPSTERDPVGTYPAGHELPHTLIVLPLMIWQVERVENPVVVQPNTESRAET